MNLIDVKDIVFRGKGEIDGQGYMWWVREILGKNSNGRPMMIYVWKGKNLEFSGITLRNGPLYHIYWSDTEDVYIHDFELIVNVMS